MKGDNPSLREAPFGTNSNGFKPCLVPPFMTPDMLKTASEMMGKMPAKEIQKMFEMASHLRGNDASSMPTAVNANRQSQTRSSEVQESSVVSRANIGGETSSRGSFLNSSSVTQHPNFPTSTFDLKE